MVLLPEATHTKNCALAGHPAINMSVQSGHCAILCYASPRATKLAKLVSRVENRSVLCACTCLLCSWLSLLFCFFGNPPGPWSNYRVAKPRF